ncbi:MAG: hypothetical protein NZ602_07395 [Thermoguttaceae bacterium]|nr:hypothetical protein [Thermoguttaceae bacterium]MDW8037766.1 hypothetical protein [Thermoguttaceae bacterium]
MLLLVSEKSLWGSILGPFWRGDLPSSGSREIRALFGKIANGFHQSQENDTITSEQSHLGGEVFFGRMAYIFEWKLHVVVPPKVGFREERAF